MIMSKLLFDSSFLISFLLEFDDNHNHAIILEQKKYFSKRKPTYHLIRPSSGQGYTGLIN